MYNIKELVKDKFWIVEVSSSKIGTIRKQGELFEFFDQRNQTTASLNTLSDFKIVDRPGITVVDHKSLNGYPTNSSVVFAVEHATLPLFKKTEKGKSVHGAGYYILKYHGMGWQHAYCPKVETLDKYEYQGPYFTEWDMNLQLKKARKNDVI